MEEALPDEDGEGDDYDRDEDTDNDSQDGENLDYRCCIDNTGLHKESRTLGCLDLPDFPPYCNLHLLARSLAAYMKAICSQAKSSVSHATFAIIRAKFNSSKIRPIYVCPVLKGNSAGNPIDFTDLVAT